MPFKTRCLICYHSIPVAVPTALFLSLQFISSASQAESLILEETLVTAQKRAENIQDVPISITAMSGEKINDFGMKDLSELSAYVPNLIISEGAVNTNIFMRGVGSGLNRSFEQSVGMFIDGIYMGRGRQFRAPFVDLERVEVLRGPQGVLFGKNTIAGAINLETSKPQPGEALSGNVTLDVGTEYGVQALTGIISGSPVDSLGLRLALKDSESDGYMKNTFLGTNEPEQLEQIARLTFAWDASSELFITGKIEHDEFEMNGVSSQIIEFDLIEDSNIPILNIAGPVIEGAVLLNDPLFTDEIDDEKSAYERLSPEQRETTVDNFVLTAEYSMGDYILTAVSGISKYEAVDRQDTDFLPVSYVNTNEDHDFEQFSQELRLTSPVGESFSYITGVYFQHTDLALHIYSHVDPRVSPDAGPVNPLTAGLTPFSRNTVFDQETDSLSAFFQGNWDVTERLTVIFGARYTREEKDATRNSAITEFTNIDTLGGLAEQASADLFKVNVTFPAFKGDRSESQFTPSLKVRFHMNDDLMLYAVAEKGFKSGGFNSNAETTVDDQEFEEESAMGFELGFKSTLLDGVAQLNGAIFHTTFDDFQETVWSGFGFRVGNAEKKITRGAEFDGQWRVTPNLTLGGALAYLDAFYDSYENGPCTVDTLVDPSFVFSDSAGNLLTEYDDRLAHGCDLSDETVAFAPEWSGTVFADYVRSLNSNLDFRFGIDVNYSGSYFYDADIDPIMEQDSYYKINARVGISENAGVWEVALIGKNLNDEESIFYGGDVPLMPGIYVGYVDAPRTVTVQGTYRF